MNIVSLLYTKIGIVSFKKRFFQKPLQFTSQVEITAEEIINLDLDKLALSLKRAFSLLPEKTVIGKVRVILGQAFWHYQRIELPADLNDQALSGFIKEQLIRKIGNQIDSSLYHYVVSDLKGKKYASVYLLTQTTLDKLITLFSFYDLKIEEVYPEALLIYKLFEPTLNKQKDEAALFLEYEKGISSGLLFNSTGLLSEQIITLKSDNLGKLLKEFKKSQSIPISRLILGGKLASSIRQDNFTKESGIWTNPLEKVLLNSPLKRVAEKLKLEDKLLLFNREISLLNLIENKKHLEVGLNIKSWKSQGVTTVPKPPQPVKETPQPINEPVQKPLKTEPPVPVVLPEEPVIKSSSVQIPISEKSTRSFKPLIKIVLIVLVTSVFTYLLITFGRSWLSKAQPISLPKINFSRPTATPTPEPTPKATPTPAITRSEIEIEILNGTGIAGMASSFQNELETLGYTVTKIGNADNYDYEQTMIITNNQAAFKLLQKDLAQFNIKQPKFEKTNSEFTTIIFGTDLKLP